jgi:hypothetical protein
LLFQWDSQHTCLHRGGVVARQVAGQALQGTSSAEQSRCRARTGRLGRHRANQAHYCRTRDERLCSRSAWIALQSDARPSDRLCHLTIADVFTLRAGFGMPHGAETKTRHGSGGDCRCSLRAGRRQQRSGHAMVTGGSPNRFDACGGRGRVSGSGSTRRVEADDWSSGNRRWRRGGAGLMPAANRGNLGGSRHVRLNLFYASVLSSAFCGAEILAAVIGGRAIEGL